jgi:hypothetical protein
MSKLQGAHGVTRPTAITDRLRNLPIPIAFQAHHLRKELESTRNAGDTPAMILMAEDAGQSVGREWIPPLGGFDAPSDKHGHLPRFIL